MPVRHRDFGDELAPPQPKRCRHCDESRSTCGGDGGPEGSERASWRVTLDHDLVETLSAIYPEWFKPQASRREPSRPATPPSPLSPSTPPSEDTFSSSGEDMAGRQAGSSGASEPSSSSPPRVSPPKVVVDDSPLQPAMDKHKESLKVKLMMRRPINQLVAQGIMPPLKTPPAYFEQCKQLERAKTGDLLKAKIQRRPDRQELERRHILEQESHVDPSLAEKQRMLKKARLADQLNDQLSHRPGPLELIKKNILHTEENIETAVKSGELAFKATSEGASGRPAHPHSYCTAEDASPSPSPPAAQHPAPGKDKNRKKTKHKHAPKARFKFHEYKGPPNAHKSPSSTGTISSVETPYELLLQQQQLLLQLMLPASPATSVASDASDVPSPALDQMKVSDLRAECKRRNLRVSGPKPQLLDRLRPFLIEKEPQPEPRSPASIASIPSVASVTSVASPEMKSEVETAEDIVESQRRQIEELERKLQASRQQLEAVRRDAAGAAASDQSRRLLQAHLCVSQLRAQLDALQSSPRLVLAENPAYILNGVKVVPIAILPQAQNIPPPPPPPPLPPPPVPDAEDSQIMDDVLEILVENGELPPSAVSESDHTSMSTDFLQGDSFSPATVLSNDGRDALAADELQRELDDIQNEIMRDADPRRPGEDLAADLGVDLLADADFTQTPSNHTDDLFDGLLNSRDGSDRMSTTPLPTDLRPNFDDMDDLSLPSLDMDSRPPEFDLKEFGITPAATDAYEYMETELIPNLFGRGHMPACDPLLGAVLARPPPRPAHKHYSWDRIEFDAT